MCLSPLTLTLTLISSFDSRVASASNRNNNNNTNNNNNDNTIVAQTFPPLRGLQRTLASSFSLSAGAQDLDHCCRLAVNDSLLIVDGSLVGFTPTQSFIADSFDAFRLKQFPCAATYTGDTSGAPTVSITYGYCRKNCPGWQRSKNSKLNQWVSPFVSFLVPAVVFCLAIPRRYVHPLLSPLLYWSSHP